MQNGMETGIIGPHGVIWGLYRDIGIWGYMKVTINLKAESKSLSLLRTPTPCPAAVP